VPDGEPGSALPSRRSRAISDVAGPDEAAAPAADEMSGECASAQFFACDLAGVDAEVAAALEREEERQRSQLELIAPKNYMSRAARQALASVIAFTSVEGYPGERWHAGTINLDEIEDLAGKRARQLFRCSYANVQPHSGTQANQAVFFALLEPGDSIVSMSLRAGGHLSHGDPDNLSGRWFRASHYGVRETDGLIDYDQLEQICRRVRPRLIVVGGSSYPRAVDFARARSIADTVGAYLLADVAHFSGLIAAGVYPNPFPSAHVVTTSTNKNLRGPRGGLILCDDEAIAAKIHRGVFPGIQGGPLPEYIAAKAVCFGEALEPAFADWARAVRNNARTLAKTLGARGYDIVTGGTDTPLVLVDLRRAAISGDRAQSALEAAGLPCNKNLIPGDPQPGSVTSGVRFGTSAVTTRGLRERELQLLGELVANILEAAKQSADGGAAVQEARRTVSQLAARFPIYDGDRHFDGWAA
jgi:glycine hydroxymethyltransferase